MKQILTILAILCFFSVMAAPASAFTAESLSINVSENGDATVTFSYNLGWAEKIAVFLRIADPATELKGALESNSGKEVSVSEVTTNSASFLINGYAHVDTGDSEMTYTTPALSFTRASEILSDYWFAPLISVDLSPAETTVIFPDGYTEYFYDSIEIPKISHAISLS
ncbi:hypothetical protein [Methanogenium sp. MK-MG]|uniref:hypothetical protein n=1 Tax=Methanogenium sp. MK-MG TaxID=2599926 RepID=UPI0013ECC09E|nr:hypothetical protein [Methanogenium sp. MK-MG]KAF1078614.1 hypothetical protein MKMG_00468 [Methanogenium sp. MK-MG]